MIFTFQETGAGAMIRYARTSCLYLKLLLFRPVLCIIFKVWSFHVKFLDIHHWVEVRLISVYHLNFPLIKLLFAQFLFKMEKEIWIENIFFFFSYNRLFVEISMGCL